MINMYALSIRQPWAFLIIHGGKDVENRTWGTDFRGPFLIHAAKGMTIVEYEDACSFAHKIDAAILVPPFTDLVRGGIVGQAELVDVRAPISEDGADRWHVRSQFGFVLANVRPIPFRPLRGQLGFFRVTGGNDWEGLT